jgi:hydroxyacylglutathione hydrolase
MPVEIKIYTGGCYQTNTYLITDGDKGVLIDPGHVSIELKDALQHLTKFDIFLTHAHFDHIQGINEILTFSHPKIHLHRLEEKWLADPRLNLSNLVSDLLPEPVVITAEPEETWSIDQSFKLFGVQTKILHTPGHTPGHTVIKWGDNLFSGDALFYSSIGRTDFPGGNYQDLMHSITAKIMTLPEDTKVFPGHGPQTTIQHERMFNPYL